jgi:hypothetical protein
LPSFPNTPVTNVLFPTVRSASLKDEGQTE